VLSEMAELLVLSGVVDLLVASHQEVASGSSWAGECWWMWFWEAHLMAHFFLPMRNLAAE
jgi:hypothetical protein